MKRFALLLAAAALAGCATSNPLPPAGPGILSPLVDSGVITEETRTKARQVQSKTKVFCDYVPTIGTLISLFSSGVGGGAVAIATGLCNAVTTAPLADGGGRVAHVNGVRLRGKLRGKDI